MKKNITPFTGGKTKYSMMRFTFWTGVRSDRMKNRQRKAQREPDDRAETVVVRERKEALLRGRVGFLRHVDSLYMQ
jgi:hypothetical protein